MANAIEESSCEVLGESQEAKPGDVLLKFAIFGEPRTKKNSQQIFLKKVKGREIPFISPSKKYKEYEQSARRQIKPPLKPISGPISVKCLYYMPTKRAVDLTNLLEATDDILVKAEVITDDNAKVIVSHDGSRVFFGHKGNPHVVITITAAEMTVPPEEQRTAE